MTSRAQELLREVLSLPAQDRADVAAELIASLEEQPDRFGDVEAEWAAEITRRAERVLSDESTGIAWDEVRRRAEEEMRRR